MVLVATALFGLVYLFAPKSGVVTARIARRLHYGHPERDRFADDPSVPVAAPQAGGPEVVRVTGERRGGRPILP